MYASDGGRNHQDHLEYERFTDSNTLLGHYPQALPTDELTPSKTLQHAGSLVERAAAGVADEWNDHLTWGDRDRITRQLREAVRLIREAAQPPTAAPLASCLECGAEESGDVIASDQCPTCAFAFAVSH